MTVSWRMFWGALLVALAVALGVGIHRYVVIEPPALTVASPSRPVVEQGVRLTPVSVTTYDSIPAQRTTLVGPDGSIWVRLAFTVERLDPDEKANSVICFGVLRASGQEYMEQSMTSNLGEIGDDMCGGTPEQPIEVGTTKHVTKYWLVPRKIFDGGARYYLDLKNPEKRIEVRV